MYEDVETGLINQLMMSYELAVMWRHPVVSSALDSYAKRVIRAYYVYESTYIYVSRCLLDSSQNWTWYFAFFAKRAVTVAVIVNLWMKYRYVW